MHYGEHGVGEDERYCEQIKERKLKTGKTSSDFTRSGDLNTIIGKNTVIEGNMRIQSSMRIDGRVNGNIHTLDTVVIGKEGSVEGQIQAKNVYLAGLVRGNITASGKVLLESTSKVLGDIKASLLTVDEGAVFDGKCKMKDESESREHSKTNGST